MGRFLRREFITAVQPIRQQLKALLTQGASYEIGAREKTPLAKTVRTCRQLLKVEPALWLFVTVEGVEPTNNAAERAKRLRSAMATGQFWLSKPRGQYLCSSYADSGDNVALAEP
jgi:hypothetical protein